MTVGEFCNRQVVIAGRDESLAEAARRIRDLHVGTLIVVDEQEGRRVPVGILTDRDIVVSVLAGDGHDVDALLVGDVMVTDLVTAEEQESLLDALKRMRSFGVRRLPVVNRNGGLEGIVTFDDLVELVAEELSDLTSLVTREQKREREEKPVLRR
jgi:CBS domain-containing protein